MYHCSYHSLYVSIHPSVYRSGAATAAHRAQVDADIEVKGLGRGRQNAPALAHELHAVNLLVRDEHGRLVHIEEGLLQGVQVAVVSLRSRTGQGIAQDVWPAALLSALAVCCTYTHCPIAASHAGKLDICSSTLQAESGMQPAGHLEVACSICMQGLRVPAPCCPMPQLSSMQGGMSALCNTMPSFRPSPAPSSPAMSQVCHAW